MLSTYLNERKAENNSGFYKIRPKDNKVKEVEEEDDMLYRSDDEVPRLNKYRVEKILGVFGLMMFRNLLNLYRLSIIRHLRRMEKVLLILTIISMRII